MVGIVDEYRMFLPGTKRTNVVHLVRPLWPESRRTSYRHVLPLWVILGSERRRRERRFLEVHRTKLG